jgi:hypothetical protein
MAGKWKEGSARKWAIKVAETRHLPVELNASQRKIASTNRFEFESATPDHQLFLAQGGVQSCQHVLSLWDLAKKPIY